MYCDNLEQPAHTVALFPMPPIRKLSLDGFGFDTGGSPLLAFRGQYLPRNHRRVLLVFQPLPVPCSPCVTPYLKITVALLCCVITCLRLFSYSLFALLSIVSIPYCVALNTSHFLNFRLTLLLVNLANRICNKARFDYSLTPSLAIPYSNLFQKTHTLVTQSTIQNCSML